MLAKNARTVFIVACTACVAFYAALFWRVVAAGEVFHRLGFDWSLFFAQALAVRAGAGSAMYDTVTIDHYLQTLTTYSAVPAELTALPVPYPPWFAAALVPLTLLPGLAALALWLALSLGAVLHLGYRVSQLLPDLGWVGSVVAILASVAVAWGLFMGQPAVLLAVPVSEMYFSLRAGRDFRAGLWLGVLLLKPQYALLLGLFILWKRRWFAVLGACLSGLAFVALGLLAAGVDSLPRFIASVRELGDLHNEIAGPLLMMNWRAIVLALRPGIGEATGQLLVWTLSLLTMLAALLLWRGRWNPTSDTFGPKFAALSIAALVGSYHSHVHGAALLIVPLALAWASPLVTAPTRVALLLAVYVPGLFVVWTAGVVNRLAVPPDANVPLWTVWPNVLPAVLFLLTLGLLASNLVDLRVPLVRTRPAHA